MAVATQPLTHAIRGYWAGSCAKSEREKTWSLRGRAPCGMRGALFDPSLKEVSDLIDSEDIDNFSAVINEAALKAYLDLLRKLDGIKDEPLEVPEESFDMFCAGYWAGQKDRNA